MILNQEVHIPASPDAVFAMINDVDRVVTCLPGAVLEQSEGNEHRGRVTVKVGPITAAYSGTIRFVHVDPDKKAVQLSARGTDIRGAGDAEAAIDLTVSESSGGSLLTIRTDLSIRGRIAQFGKTAIATVSDRLLGQFAGNLASLLETAPTAAASTASPAGVRDGVDRHVDKPPASAPPAAPELNALALLLPAGAKAWLPVVAAGGLGLLHGWMLSRLRSQRHELERLRRGC